MVKEFLSQRGVSYQERDVSTNRSYAEEMVRNTGQTGVPVTVIDGQTVIGFDRDRLEQILAQRQSNRRPTFGVSIADASKITVKQSRSVIPGAYVGNVRQNSIAERIGLTSGDIITQLNLKPITNAADLEQSLLKLNQGSHFSLSLIRGDSTLTKEGIF